MDGRTGGRAEFPRPREKERKRERSERARDRLLFSSRCHEDEREDRTGRMAEAMLAGQANIGDHEQRERERESPPSEYRYFLGGPPGPDV